MDECPYRCHERLEQRTLEAEKKGVLVDSMMEKIETLFTYHDELRVSIQNNRETMLDVKASQHSWAGKLSGQIAELGDDIKTLCGDYKTIKKDYEVLNADFSKFAWFRDPLNKWQKTLPWFVLGVIIVGLVSFIAPFEVAGKLLDIIKKVWGWFK